jgi:hypothetical protein
MKEKVKKLLLCSFIFVMLVIAATTPVVIGADKNILVTFNPEGSVTLDVWPLTLAFGNINANTVTNSSSSFTLYNNGTTRMETKCETNTSTDSSDMICDADGAGLDPDDFSLRFTHCDNFEGNMSYISTTALATTLNNSLDASGSDTFKIEITLVDITADHAAQTTMVNFTGSIDS